MYIETVCIAWQCAPSFVILGKNATFVHMKGLLSIIIGIFIGVLCFAQKSSFHDYQGKLFRISGNGLNEPSYILGTLHTIPGDYVYQLPDFENIVSNVKQIICEYDFNAQWDDLDNDNHSEKEIEELLDHIDKLYTDKKGKTRLFTDDLSFRERDKVMGSLTAWGITDRRLWTYAYLNENLSIHYRKALLDEINSKGYNFQLWQIPIDNYIVDSIAPRYNLPVVSLDKKDGMGRFSNKQKEIDLLWNPKTTRKQYSRYLGSIILNYRNNHEGTMIVSQAYLNSDFTWLKGIKVDNSLMMRERNSWWMQQIPSLIQSKPSLMVVGIAHLMDMPDYLGILSSLEELGYRVERVE